MGKKIGLGVAGLVLLVSIIYYVYATFTYSEGIRAGLLFKFSKKGFICKTYEGELNLGGVNADSQAGLVNNIWVFSVNDNAAAEELMGMEGKYVRLKYKEVNKSFFWQGETNYFVYDVEEVEK